MKPLDWFYVAACVALILCEFGCAVRRAPASVPPQDSRWNRCATAANEWAMRVHDGVQDYAAWQRAVEACRGVFQ